MDVRQLSALVAIADHGTFSAAAQSLYTVQSNVSGRISKLERELGVLLVDRNGSELTDEGSRVVERARRILREINDISAEIASLDDEVTGEARIGSIGTTARWLMPQLLAAIESSHPNVHPIVHEGSTSTLVPNLLNGILDAVIAHLPLDDPELQVEPLFAEDLLLLANTSHPIADAGEMALSELGRVPILLPPKGSALRRVLDRAAGAHGTTLVAQAEIDGVRLLASLAIDGYGAAIVPATAVPPGATNIVETVRVPELPQRVVAWVTRRRPAANQPTRAVLATLLELLPARAPLQPGVHLGSETCPLAPPA